LARSTAAGTVALSLSLLAVPTPATAAPATHGAPAPTAVPTQAPPVPSPPPEISPALDDVALDSAEHKRAADRFDDTVEARADALADAERNTKELAALTEDEADLTKAVVEATDRKRRDEGVLDRAQERVRQLAVENYVNDRTGDDSSAMLDLDASGTNDAGREQVLVTAVHDDTMGDLRDARAAVATARADVHRHTTDRDAVRDEMKATATALEKATGDADRLAVEVLLRLDEKRATRGLSIVRGTELPLVVLDAYYKASQHLAFDEPACGISWWGLAGIGYIESGHGTFGDSTVLANGDLSTPITGIPLDGTNNTAHIGDSDGGTYDGDPLYDRAVGPMQFIPQTWESWKRDGNGDGAYDPQNLYDAAYAAAAYTCAGGPMRSDEDLSRGYFSYNHDAAYVAVVLARAKSYAAAVDLPEPVPLEPAAAAAP
jgi:membrane-bound lytic murein transglycosylase B